MNMNRAPVARSLRQRSLYGEALGISLVALLVPGAALAAPPVLPTGGAVTAGTATIKSTDAGITIKQSGGKAIISWTDFSIGQGGTVNFNNGGGATLNRVTGANLSAIDGTLMSNGSVYLINPNGVIIGATGKVQTTGTFVASSLDVGDDNFLNGGDVNFYAPPAGAAAVVNYGKVGSSGGDVVMIATDVTNTGKITAAKGTVGLLSGVSVTLRDQAQSDGKFAISGYESGSVTNGGAIAAASAELRAAGGNVYALAGLTAGTIKATGVGAFDGHVYLTSNGGLVTVGGMISATGAPGAPGQVVTSGFDVGVDPSTKVTAGGNGSWTIARTNTGYIEATEAAAVSYSLNHGVNVSEASSYGIIVDAPISWRTPSTLALGTSGFLALNAKISVLGAGSVVVFGADVGAQPNTFLASSSGSIDYGSVDHGGSLTVNGNSYNLLYSLDALDAIDGVSAETGGSVTQPSGGMGGYYALATSLSGAGRTFNQALVGDDSTQFNGVLEGLGNQISNVTINSPNANSTGLFAQNAGIIRDLRFVGSVTNGAAAVGTVAGYNGGSIVNVSADQTTGLTGAGGGYVGGIVGFNEGSIVNVSTTGTVTGAGSQVGGVAGYSSGTVSSVTTNDTVSGDTAGGVVGYNAGGSITFANAYGATTGASYVGGVVGDSFGTIYGASSSGSTTVTSSNGSAGGIAGYASGSITYVGATGTVTGGDNTFVGGVVGQASGLNMGNLTSNASVIGGAGSSVGGLVGFAVEGSLQASTSYATVRGDVGSYVGGAVGYALSLTLSGFNGFGSVYGGAQGGAVGGAVGYALNSSIAYASNYAQTVSGGGTAAVGGIVGVAVNSQVVNGFATNGAVLGGDGSSVGGIVGSAISGSTIDHSTGGYITVAGGAKSQVGGLIGSAAAGTVVTYDVSVGGTVTGGDSSSVGGLIGSAVSTSVQHVFAASTATGGRSAFVGGLIGNANDTNVDDAYTATAVTGGRNASIGAVIGKARSGSLTNSSYDIDVTGARAAVGVLGPKPPKQSKVVGLDNGDFYNQPGLTEFNFSPYAPAPQPPS